MQMITEDTAINEARSFIQYQQDVHHIQPHEWRGHGWREVAAMFLSGYDEDTNVDHIPTTAEIDLLMAAVNRVIDA